ncbi:MAG: hypothetical protein INR69_03900 [Mucilaginibacter polytrichastri]|nr:hypothetical protein [Mucilaginibacter polytrichastri]
MVTRSSINFTKVIGLLFIVLLCYNFHRYILQYNSVRTSPTYQNTPLTWKVGKYLVVGLLAFLAYFHSRFVSPKKPWEIAFFVAFITWSLTASLLYFLNFNSFSFNEMEYTIWGILLFPMLFIEPEKKAQLINFIPKNFRLIALLTISTGFLVVINYYVTDRLPALGYKGSLVRYGGFWDDPNGFGLFCCYLFYIALDRKLWLYSLLLLVCIAFTVSFSAYLITIFVFVLWGFKGGKLNRVFLYIAVSVTALLLAAGLFFQDKVAQIALKTFEQKRISIEQHSKIALDFFFFPYLNRGISFHETWYISYLYNYTPLSPGILFIILSFLAFTVFRKSKNYCDIYSIIFLAGCFFIPVFIVFPLNVLFIIFIYTYTTLPDRNAIL